MPRFKKILCPVDFDQNSLPALRLASELAQARKATPPSAPCSRDAAGARGRATFRKDGSHCPNQA